MKALKKEAALLLIVCSMLLLLPTSTYAWEPNARDLDEAVKTGDFAEYFANISTWLNKKMSAYSRGISEAAVKRLLRNPAFVNALAQRQVISKLGVGNIEGFARGDQDNRTFLSWLLRNTEAMELYLEGATPIGIRHRKDNSWGLPVSALGIWNRIFSADPESKEGVYLRLAIAIGLNPPGTGNRGAGQAKKPADPVDRYNHLKSAHKNNELFTTFGDLTVWEYRQIVSSNASDADLAWGREMLNTWRPDLRIGQRVVNSTSQVWRRNSPIPFNDTFKNVLAGGGKCGPRSSWAVFICQAFGIPVVGVRQPRHACVAYKSLDGWRVAYGRGWHVSKCQGLSGPDFVEGVTARSDMTQFVQVERLRWLASALTSKEQAAAVMEVARTIAQAKVAAKTDLTASEKAEEAEADPGAYSKRSKPKVASQPATKPEPPFKAVRGVIHVEAEAFAKMGGKVSYGNLQTPGVIIHDCYTGGKQVHFQSHMQGAWVDYAINVPVTGTYELEMRVSVVNREQVLDIRSGGDKLATVRIPNSYGLWATTPAANIRLNRGPQTLRVSTGFQRGLALRWFELKLKRRTR